MSTRPPGQRSSLLVQGRLKLSELFPLASRTRAPLSSAFFGPILLTLAFVVVVIANLNAQTPDEVLLVLRAIAVGMAVAGLAFFHVLAGRIKPWWWAASGFVGAAALTWLDRRFRFPFLGTFAGVMPDMAGDSFVATFFNELLNTAIPEEILKAAPIVVVVLLGLRASRGRTALTPIAGALLGAACGAGFTLIEADKYAFCRLYPTDPICADPASVARMLVEAPQLLVPDAVEAFLQVIFRMVSQVSMHAAWTGITGYYMGLALRNRAHAERLAGGGLLLAASMHALWNSTPDNSLIEWIVAALSYAVFASAILKGLQMERGGGPRAGAVAAVPPIAAVAIPAAGPIAAVAVAPNVAVAAVPTGPVVRLRSGSLAIAVRPGDTVRAHQLPQFDAPAGDDVIAEVVENPTNPSVWGLRNRSSLTWHATVRPGDEREIQPGHSVRLAGGVTIRLGNVMLEVE